LTFTLPKYTLAAMPPLLDLSFQIEKDTEYPDEAVKYIRVGDVVALQDVGDVLTSTHYKILYKYFPDRREGTICR